MLSTKITILPDMTIRSNNNPPTAVQAGQQGDNRSWFLDITVPDELKNFTYRIKMQVEGNVIESSDIVGNRYIIPNNVTVTPDVPFQFVFFNNGAFVARTQLAKLIFGQSLEVATIELPPGQTVTLPDFGNNPGLDFLTYNAQMEAVWNDLRPVVDARIKSNGLIEITYEDLAALKSANSGAGNMVPDALYKITNNKTTYRQPGTNVIKTNAPIEPIIVQAIAPNQISRIAWSTVYKGDILTYDFDDNRCEDRTTTPGSGTPRTGRILRRKCVTVGETGDLDGDWRHEEYAMFKATGIAWTPGTAVVKDSVYQVGSMLYLAINDGVPTSADDTYYFYPYGNTNEYCFPLGFYRNGLTLDMVDYAERSVFNSSIDHTIKTPTRSSVIKPEGNYTGIQSVLSDSSNGGLPGIIFMFSSSTDKPKGNHLESFSANSIIRGSYNQIGNYNKSSIVESNYNNIGISNEYTRIFYHVDGRNIITSFNRGSDVYGISNFINARLSKVMSPPSGTVTIIGNYCKVELRSYDTTLKGSYLETGINSTGSRIFGEYSNIGNGNTGTKTGLNFKNITIESSVNPGDISSITELHNKAYPHRITKGLDGKKWATWTGTDGYQAPPLQLL